MSNQTQNTDDLPTTPDWSKAPVWAEYFCINKDGAGFFTENFPYLATWREPDGWVISSGQIKIRFAGKFDPTNWQKSKQQRPKIEGVKPNGVWIDEAEHFADVSEIKPPRTFSETATVYFNSEITGYLAGKNSFITSLVDLLLARMAKEERFSDDENRISETAIEPFDVIVMSVYGGQIYYIVNYSDQERFDVSFGIISNLQGELCDVSADNYFWHGVHKTRTITELEAVEFRKAMEAVYG